jgi:hypothetical protein
MERVFGKNLLGGLLKNVFRHEPEEAIKDGLVGRNVFIHLNQKEISDIDRVLFRVVMAKR